MNIKVMNAFCGINSKVRLNKLFDYMLEYSMKQGETLKEKLKDLNGNWVIYQWDVDTNDMPDKFDGLTIQTYYTHTRKFHVSRNYDVSRNGELIVRIKTKWLLVNPEKKLPTRITDRLGEIYDREDGYEVLEKDVELMDDNYKECGEYTVKKTDIDYNLHANNARYIEWVENYLDDDITKKVEAVYRKRLKLNETVEIHKLVENSNIYPKLISSGVLKTIIRITKRI